MFHLISVLRSWSPFGKRRWSGKAFLPLKNYRSNLWLKAKSHYVFRDNEIFCIIKELLDSSASFARSKAWNICLWENGSIYKDACQLDEKSVILKLIFMALISMSSHYIWINWRISITILKFKQVETSLIIPHQLDLKFQLWTTINFYKILPFLSCFVLFLYAFFCFRKQET